MPGYKYNEFRAEVDTGATQTVTSLLNYLHDCRWYDKNSPCKLQLTRAINPTLSVMPLGEGYLYIPVSNVPCGYVAVLVHYSSKFIPTLLNKNDVLKVEDDWLKSFQSQFIKKNYSYNSLNGSFKIRCVHEKANRKDVLVKGIYANGRMFTRALIPPDLPADHEDATIFNSSELAAEREPVFKAEVFSTTVAACENIMKSKRRSYDQQSIRYDQRKRSKRWKR